MRLRQINEENIELRGVEIKENKQMNGLVGIDIYKNGEGRADSRQRQTDNKLYRIFDTFLDYIKFEFLLLIKRPG